MSAVRKLLPGRRKLMLSISVALLIAVFFFGFFFYYVPSNRDSLNKYAFSILQSISDNIRQKHSNNSNVYVKQVLGYNSNADSIKSDNEEKGLDIQFKKFYPSDICADIGLQSVKTNSKNITLIKQGIEGQRFYYAYILQNQPPKNNDTLTVHISGKNMMQPLLEVRIKDLFESFMLLKICAGKAYTVYSDNNLNIGSEISPDTILASQGKMKVLVPGIRDLDIKGQTYKMLYIPFNNDGEQLLICGFIKEDAYSTQLHLIPVSFIYPIIIAVLILLIALPLIKFYIMGSGETLQLTDIFGFMISIFVGSTLLTLVIIQVIFILNGDSKAKEDVGVLSTNIDSGFCGEIQQAYRQLEAIDEAVNKATENDGLYYTPTYHSDVSEILVKYLSGLSDMKREDVYYNFDRFAWVDKSGKQFLKAAVKKEVPLFQMVDKRKYFDVFKKGRAYTLPGHPDISIGLEPIYNWIDGEFTYVISKRSKVKDAYIATIVTSLNSVTHTVLPPGYGFCIIDAEGKVQVHSDVSRSLNENFLSQASPALPLKEAIASRQNMSFNEIKFYGKLFSVNIKPVSNLPLYLVTFYDKGYIVPVNMRILLFSLLLCFASYIVLLLLWLFAIRKRHYANPLLFSPMDVLHWVIPKQHAATYYRYCNKFLLCYIAAMLMVVFTQAKFTSINSNYFVLNIILLTPINIVCALAIFVDPPPISSLLIKQIRPAKIALVTLVIITLLSTIYTAAFIEAKVFELLSFQFAFVIIMLLHYRYAKPITFERPGQGRSYMLSYSLLIELLVICLAILPAGLFTWYSHNQEIIQGVKKQQLYVANRLQERLNPSLFTLKDWDTGLLPNNTVHNVKYRNGVYAVYTTTINQYSMVIDSIKISQEKSFEKFYFDVANNISNNYYDPQNYPALQDSSYDKRWLWSPEDNNQLSFFYQLKADTGQNKSATVIHLNTEIPKRFNFLTASSKGLMLLVLVSLVLYGLFAIIHYISSRLFLQKYITHHSSSAVDWSGIEALVQPYRHIANIDAVAEKNISTLPGEFKSFPPNLEEEETIAAERKIIFTATEYKDFYDFIWRTCTDEQKYLLSNFAKSGLMNFKNTADIYSLLDQGILIQEKGRIQIFSKSFRAYILQLIPTAQMDELREKIGANSTWQSFRKPFLLILIGGAAFIFFTQQEAWQRIMALITAFTTSLPLLLSAFSSGGGGKKN